MCLLEINTTIYFNVGSGNDETEISMQNYDYDVMIPITCECINNVDKYFSKYYLL